MLQNGLIDVFVVLVPLGAAGWFHWGRKTSSLDGGVAIHFLTSSILWLGLIVLHFDNSVPLSRFWFPAIFSAIYTAIGFTVILYLPTWLIIRGWMQRSRWQLFSGFILIAFSLFVLLPIISKYA